MAIHLMPFVASGRGRSASLGRPSFRRCRSAAALAYTRRRRLAKFPGRHAYCAAASPRTIGDDTACLACFRVACALNGIMLVDELAIFRCGQFLD